MFSKNARQLKGEPSHCHENSARVWLTDPSAFKIGTGYALSPDGLWRQHSWAIDLKDCDKLIETTMRRTKYFGIFLNKAETLEFVAGTVPEIAIWINEAQPKRLTKV